VEIGVKNGLKFISGISFVDKQKNGVEGKQVIKKADKTAF